MRAVRRCVRRARRGLAHPPRGGAPGLLAWTAQGLSRHSYRPASEVVFVFDDAAGYLDISCGNGKQTVEQLRGLFAETVV